MKKVIDARGLSCPEPVLMLRRIIDSADEIELLVDSPVCADGCGRLASSKGFSTALEGSNGQYAVTLTRGRDK